MGSRKKKKNTTSRIEKPWGHEEIIETNKKYTVKRLFMKSGHQCSFQYHKRKMETIVNLEGVLTIVLENKVVKLNPGDTITIKPFKKHRMAAKEADCLYLESSTSELNDVVRVDDDYGRN